MNILAPERARRTEGQLWELINDRDVEGIFRSWGATEIYRFSRPKAAVTPYMLRLDGKWHYAHKSGSSVYCNLTESYQGPTGRMAVIQYNIDGAERRVRYAEEELEWAKKELAKLHSQANILGG